MSNNQSEGSGLRDFFLFVNALATIILVVIAIVQSKPSTKTVEATEVDQVASNELSETTEQSAKIGKITFDKIMMYSEHAFYILTVKENNRLDIRFIRAYGEKYWDIDIICDVPEGEPMWIEEYKNTNWASCQTSAHIHIRSPKDVQGSQWDAGKHGQGIIHTLAD